MRSNVTEVADLPRIGIALVRTTLVLALVILVTPLLGATGNHDRSGASFQVLVPAAEADVLQAVKEVVRDQIVHGTYVYEKDKTLTGAEARPSASAFGTWHGSGTVFYKVADSVLDPRHFRASNGLGTIAIRYLVTSAGPAQTSLRIDAVFVEDSRHRADLSDGSVESAEYDAINQHLFAARKQREASEAPKTTPAPTTTQALQAATSPVTKPLATDTAPTATDAAPTATNTALVASNAGSVTTDTASVTTNTVPPDTSTASLEELERHVSDLRRQVEARIRDDGTAVRSAPFRRASAVQVLPASTKVLIVILTPYWYGVETPDGHHGWIRRSQLESLP